MDKIATLDAPTHTEAEYEAAVDRRFREMERTGMEMAQRQERIERLQAKTLSMLAALREQTDSSRKADQPGANGMHSPDAEEVNPLARIAGSYADDPFWEEFVQLMEESRQAAEAAPAPVE